MGLEVWWCATIEDVFGLGRVWCRVLVNKVILEGHDLCISIGGRFRPNERTLLSLKLLDRGVCHIWGFIQVLIQVPVRSWIRLLLYILLYIGSFAGRRSIRIRRGSLILEFEFFRCRRHEPLSIGSLIDATFNRVTDSALLPLWLLQRCQLCALDWITARFSYAMGPNLVHALACHCLWVSCVALVQLDRRLIWNIFETSCF